MPIYDYKCGECGHSFEVMTKLSDRNNLQPCPECGGSGKHVITPVHFHLPGNRLDYPTAAAKWTRDHERAAAQGKRKDEEIKKDLESSMY